MATTTRSSATASTPQQLFGTLDAIKADPVDRQFQFRARNRWIDGAHNRTTIRDFYAANQEDTSRADEFVIDAGEPAILLGTDTGAEPGRVPAARARRVPDDVARLRRRRPRRPPHRGRVDARGRHGRAGRARSSDDYRNGFEQIRVCFRVEGDAPEEKLREVVERAQQRSAVFDMVTNGVPVTVDVATAYAERGGGRDGRPPTSPER